MNQHQKDVLLGVIAEAKSYVLYATLFSASVNLLMLTPILYMLQVYDRVVSSGSMTTLTMLTLLMLLLLSSSGCFEWARSKLLVAANVKLEKRLREAVSVAAFKSSLATGLSDRSASAMSDLIALRQFACGNGVHAVMDIPWTPIYILVMYMFHPLFGIAAIVTTIILVLLALLQQKATGKRIGSANSASRAAQTSFARNLRNVEVLHGMGMAENIRAREGELFDEALNQQAFASSIAGGLSALTKSIRLISQSLLLGLGAYLALRQEISPGMMIAGSLLLGKALSPIDILVGTWKGFVDAAEAFQRLRIGLRTFPIDEVRMELPTPTGEVSVEQIIVTPPTSRTPIIKGINLSVPAGGAIGIIGPSAGGKTSLLRAILGVWPLASGSVRLDGADINQWNRNDLGAYIGYLPQAIELFDGSIADNICRFSVIDSAKIIAAAEAAGIHQMIQKLPEGYETVISASTGVLSAGQRQRLGFARAIYGNPKLIILDEPNSNLDTEGEKDLLSALNRLKESGSTIIVVTHRTAILALVDKVAVLKDGFLEKFGPTNEVLKTLNSSSSNIRKLPSKATPNT
ncbi:MAG: type I secretion system permease/ATPase [Flammeovirgaceae bacterium TMED32]|nr:MAG: type I secretion system permease/ATPase [Flammeovirgaceae bacterium TMED32]|tara:strand:- start:5643 stop:7367 length:1725 start_codon:yes stop_codon:yes gene_type:complete